jgi:hypothetical protein
VSIVLVDRVEQEDAITNAVKVMMTPGVPPTMRMFPPLIAVF